MPASLKDLLRDAKANLAISRVRKDPKLIEELITLANDDIRTVKFNAIYVLGEICHDSSVPVLRQKLSDKDWSICRETVRALGKIHTSTKYISIFLPCFTSI